MSSAKYHLKLDLHNFRILFDKLIIRYLIVERHLSNNAAIFHNAAFEKAFVKSQCDNDAALSRTEKDHIKTSFLNEEEEGDDNEILIQYDDAAQRLISGSKQRKRARLVAIAEALAYHNQ